MADSPGRILLVDDQYLIREGLASLLELEDSVQVVGAAANGLEAIKLACELLPDIILMDIRMPELGGVEATVQIKQRAPSCQIIMLTTFDDEELVVQSLLAGACGYLLKDILPADLVRAVHSALAGVYQLAPEVAGKLVASLRRQPGAKLHVDPSLTAREVEVLKLIVWGASNKEIARMFEVSEGTVKNHVSNILMRLGLRDRMQAAVYAVEHGLNELKDCGEVESEKEEERPLCELYPSLGLVELRNRGAAPNGCHRTVTVCSLREREGEKGVSGVELANRSYDDLLEHLS